MNVFNLNKIFKNNEINNLRRIVIKKNIDKIILFGFFLLFYSAYITNNFFYL